MVSMVFVVMIFMPRRLVAIAVIITKVLLALNSSTNLFLASMLLLSLLQFFLP